MMDQARRDARWRRRRVIYNNDGDDALYARLIELEPDPARVGHPL